MSRRRKATKRAILPDPLHGSPLISSLVNAVMLSGKKSLAQRIVYKSIEKMAEKVGKGNPLFTIKSMKRRDWLNQTTQVSDMTTTMKARTSCLAK